MSKHFVFVCKIAFCKPFVWLQICILCLYGDQNQSAHKGTFDISAKQFSSGDPTLVPQPATNLAGSIWKTNLFSLASMSTGGICPPSNRTPISQLQGCLVHIQLIIHLMILSYLTLYHKEILRNLFTAYPYKIMNCIFNDHISSANFCTYK